LRTTKGSVHWAAATEQRALAEQHVELGRRIVERQHKIIATMKATQLDTGSSEQLLTVLMVSQKIFEDDLARLIKTEGW